jgi:PEP-CTERM motif
MHSSPLRSALTAVAVGAAVALGASSAQAATITWDLSNGVAAPGHAVLNTQIISACGGCGITVTENGFTGPSALSTGTPNTALFLKNGGGDEIGVGLVNGGTDRELTPPNIIQIDFTAARTAGVTGFAFQMNSSTTPDAWQVFGSNSATSLGVSVATGTSEALQTLTGTNATFAFYNFEATAGDVLVASVSGVSAVPEPATWGMMLLGFLGLGFAFRQSRRKVSFA